MKIMLVDDDAGSLRGLAIALKMLRHSCDSFDNPVEAKEKFLLADYDVVITDVCMPQISGIELGNQIRRLNPNVNIIYMSGQLSKNAEEELEKDNSCIYMRKPISFEEIRETLHDLCGSRRFPGGLLL